MSVVDLAHGIETLGVELGERRQEADKRRVIVRRVSRRQQPARSIQRVVNRGAATGLVGLAWGI
jgi:hypothetical protein